VPLDEDGIEAHFHITAFHKGCQASGCLRGLELKLIALTELMLVPMPSPLNPQCCNMLEIIPKLLICTGGMATQGQSLIQLLGYHCHYTPILNQLCRLLTAFFNSISILSVRPNQGYFY